MEPSQHDSSPLNILDDTPVYNGKAVSVIVDHVTIRYLTPSGDKRHLAQANPLRRTMSYLLGRQVRIPLYPVYNASIIAFDGDSIGIVGTNGAGKSTILRAVGGFERPYAGEVWATSQPAHLGVNAALITRLDAYRNAYLGLLAQGLSPEEAKDLVPKIIEYAGIGSAAHRAINTYSWGMNARLRFAVATAVHPKILIVDEALGGGDAAFTQKSRQTIDEILEDAGTIFTVSHNINEIKRTCNRVVWINKGHIIADGDVNEITAAYTQWIKYLAGKPDEANAVLLDYARSYEPPKFETVFEKRSRPADTSTTPEETRAKA